MAALFDSQTGQYLIQRCVLRVAPSLRVARTAADALRDIKGQEEKGHALVVGSQLPTRSVSLPEAEVEAKFVAELLNGVGFEVHALMWQAATKTDVQNKIEGAKWAHLACHGAFDEKSLMLTESPADATPGAAAIAGLGQQLGGWLQSQWTSIQKEIGVAWNQAKSWASGALKSAGQAISNAASSVKQGVANAANTVAGAAGKAAGWLQGFLSELFNRFVSFKGNDMMSILSEARQYNGKAIVL